MKKLLRNNIVPNFLLVIFGSKKMIQLFIVFFISQNIFSQDSTASKGAAYNKIITERVSKIVNKLGISDSLKFSEVVAIISHQYIEVNKIQDIYKAAIATLKTKSLAKEDFNSLLKNTEEDKSKSLKKLHSKFLKALNKKLDEKQIDLVKNGMTYDILNVTYNAYKDEIPTLTKPQSDKIYNWLIEARELAMDEGSSEDKHKMFGKYKGKINNFLSSEGYDMKKEEDAWRVRIKERNASKKLSS